MLECIACSATFEEAPGADGITFDPADKLISICKECCRKIAKRYRDKWELQ